jgi:hypothetical protein
MTAKIHGNSPKLSPDEMQILIGGSPDRAQRIAGATG